MDIENFRKIILSYYHEAGRVFPWRESINPWGVLVSEFMLQQTQTERVAAYWTRWMEKWPSPGALADASLEEVFREWSGLGYNRRARFLRESAKIISGYFGGKVPESREELKSLPGVGEYSSGAIACFAYNVPAVFIETNIRRVLIHFFFRDRKDVHDAELYPILEKSLDPAHPREWYWALMDYGAELKKVTANPNRRSAHYAKQGKFEGSLRQVRGAVIKSLAKDGPASIDELQLRTGFSYERLQEAIQKLAAESMVAEHGGNYRIP